MESVAAILAAMSHAPVGVTAGLGSAALLVTLYLRMQSGSLDKVTSISKLQSEQVEDLLQQNRELAKDLHSLRKEMAEALNEITKLRDEIGRVRHRLGLYETHCINCTQRPPGMVP
jgi:peptidoglycan hydrolase CwlO-like protein